MPTIVRLSTCTIYMYWKDHGVPHFHVVDREEKESKVALDGLTVLKPGANRRAMKEALEWASENEDLLRENWEYHQNA